jgi:sortase A
VVTDPSAPHSRTPNGASRTELRRAARAARRGRFLRRLADLLIIVGGLVLAFPFWSAAYTHYQQGRLGDQYEAATAAFAEVVRSEARTLERLPSPDARMRHLATLYSRQLKPGKPIGRLTIPSLKLNRVVTQGAGGRDGLSPKSDDALLRGGPVHYGTTPLPGAGEPFAVAGHRTTYGAPFYHLNKLRRGDPIAVETPYGRFRYQVEKVTTVAPNDVGVLYDRGYALVLTTCTPLYSARQRLVVWARADGFSFR